MGLRKYQKVEKAEVVSKDGHRAIDDDLRRLGKTSAKDLTPEQRKSLTDKAL
jgi:hypothetical protein